MTEYLRVMLYIIQKEEELTTLNCFSLFYYHSFPALFG